MIISLWGANLTFSDIAVRVRTYLHGKTSRRASPGVDPGDNSLMDVYKAMRIDYVENRQYWQGDSTSS